MARRPAWSPAAALARLSALPGWDVAQANWLGRCAGKRAAGPGIHGIHMATCYAPVNPHVEHMSNTCHTHAIHMEDTWGTHCFRSCSVTLCHSRSWVLLATGGVIHQAIVSLLCCTFTCLQGFYHALPNKRCSHHIPQITTVDIQPDGKYNFRKNSAVDKRQKSLRLILLSN